MLNRIFKSIFAILLGMCLCACSSSTVKPEEKNESIKEEKLDMEYKELKGRYVDVVGGLAQMEINVNEDKKSVEIVINWENDEDEISRWIMNASFQGAKLAYKDCEEYLISYTVYGEEVPATISQSSGYFKVNKSNNTLAWTGSSSNRCKTCIFEKVSSTTTKEEEERLKKEAEKLAEEDEDEDEFEEDEDIEEDDDSFDDDSFDDEFVDEEFDETGEVEEEEYFE